MKKSRQRECVGQQPLFSGQLLVRRLTFLQGVVMNFLSNCCLVTHPADEEHNYVCRFPFLLVKTC